MVGLTELLVAVSVDVRLSGAEANASRSKICVGLSHRLKHALLDNREVGSLSIRAGLVPGAGSIVVVGCALWLVIAKWVLERTGSALPKVAIQRLGLG